MKLADKASLRSLYLQANAVVTLNAYVELHCLHDVYANIHNTRGLSRSVMRFQLASNGQIFN
jgi:hypothetical protein